MKIQSFALLVIACALLLFSPATDISAAQKRKADASSPVPPSFVRVLNVRMGVTAERELERRLGDAEVTIGGHSNSGRGWYFHNGLQLRSDGFDLGNEGYILDTLVFSGWRGQLGDTREFAKSGVGVWKRLRVGMTPTACLAVLSTETHKPTITPDTLTWRKEVRSARRGKRALFLYEATLRFSNGRLDSLLLSCEML
jgi:hypothetical protein